MKAKARNIRTNIIIWTGIAILASVLAYSILHKTGTVEVIANEIEEKPIDRGIIDSLWIVPAHEDARLNLETNQWEYAPLEESYWMRLVDTNTFKTRTLSIARVSYEMYFFNYQNGVRQFTQIFEDTASYNNNMRKAAQAAEEGAEHARLTITPEPPK